MSGLLLFGSFFKNGTFLYRNETRVSILVAFYFFSFSSLKNTYHYEKQLGYFG